MNATSYTQVSWQTQRYIIAEKLTRSLLDLNPDNILLGFENQQESDELIRDVAANPSPYKEDGDNIIYASRIFRSYLATPSGLKIVDFGSAVRGDVAQPHNHPIQPLLLRAPEVILQAGWSYSADIWNLGAMVSRIIFAPTQTIQHTDMGVIKMWDLAENTTLFKARNPTSDKYDPEQHLAEMVALLGPAPDVLLKRAEKAAQYFSVEGIEHSCVSKCAPTQTTEHVLTAATREIQKQPRSRCSASFS